MAYAYASTLEKCLRMERIRIFYQSLRSACIGCAIFLTFTGLQVYGQLAESSGRDSATIAAPEAEREAGVVSLKDTSGAATIQTPTGGLDADDNWSGFTSLSLDPPSPESREEFATLKEVGIFVSPVHGMRSKYNSSTDRIFALVKMGVILGSVLLWVSLLSVSSSPSLRTGMGADDRKQAQRWTVILFFCGIVALGAAIVLPASAVGATVLVAGTLFPYSQFVRWQNQRSPVTNIRLGWFPVVPQPQATRPVFEAVDTENESAGAEVVSIRLIGKSALRGNDSGLSQAVEDSPAFQYVLSLIRRAVLSSATDLHINSRSHSVEVKQRVDGSLETMKELPLDLGASVINILKVISELSIADKRRSQDGSFLADVNDRRLSFRVSSQGTQTGEKLSIRILDPSKSFTDLTSLGMPSEMVERFTVQLGQRHGLILFVGATGAGKSTTACASLQMIDSTIKNIVSIEDPIEYQIPSIDQIEVNLKSGQTFESALRSVLRLDADVIFVGEIRDAETAKIAVQAAQSGQLVLATMHSTDSIGGFQRLADLTGDLAGVASTVRAIMAQTLVRKLCPHCRMEYSPDDSTASAIGTSVQDSLFRSNTELVLNCPVCEGRRFLRRTAVYELTEVVQEMRELVRSHASPTELIEASKRGGMIPLREQASNLVRDGIISVNELNRVFGD